MMTSRRVFLLSFLLSFPLAGALVAGSVTILQTQDPRGATSPDPVPSAAPGVGTEARSKAIGKQVMGFAWSSTWSATVPKIRTVPEQALGIGRCTALYKWATARSAVPRGTASAAFTLAAAQDSSLLVRSLRIVKGRTIPVPEGRDVECVSANDQTLAPGLDRWGQLSLDQPKDLKLSRHVRPGGVIGGVIDTRTVDCSCEWWIELDVLENGAQRTVRIDDAGRPFRIAPPVAGIGTPADGQSQQYGAPDLALARRGDTRAHASDGLSVSATRLLADDAQEMWMVADREVPAVRQITANLDVPGVPCERMQRALMAADARPAGHDTYTVQLADTSPTVVIDTIVDVSLRVEKVRRAGAEPTGYGCYPYSWTLQGNKDREETTVQLVGDSSRLPVFTAERTAESVARDTFFFGVNARGPRNIEYHFTIEVTVEDASGKPTRYTLDDAGRPFVLAARPYGTSASDEEFASFEIGQDATVG